MTPLKWNKVVTAGLALTALFGFFALMTKGNLKTVFAVLCGAVLIGTFVVQAVFWRCPACKKSLPYNNSAKMKYCPYCTENLDKPAAKQ